MRDSQIDPDELEEMERCDNMTEEEWQEAVEQYEIDRQMEKYNL